MCHFAKVGKGCKKANSILAKDVEKHKKQYIVIHVDLLNESVHSLQKENETLKERLKSMGHSIDEMKRERAEEKSQIERLNHAFKAIKEQLVVPSIPKRLKPTSFTASSVAGDPQITV